MRKINFQAVLKKLMWILFHAAYLILLNLKSKKILWDRIFGTYEKEDEVVRYGITNNI
jgi:sterol desaturase/sphingolipid hydroxylase (fatty acid hydroxylase superfamily)